MKSIEKLKGKNLDLVILFVICLVSAILIYNYQYDRRILLGVENVTPGGELTLLFYPVIYLIMTWEGRFE